MVERLQPEIDGGRFAVKRTVGESVSITVDVFADGHDLIAGVLKYRVAGAPEGRPKAEGRGPKAEGQGPKTEGQGPKAEGQGPRAEGQGPREELWDEIPLTELGDDRWGASFTVTELGEYEYTVEAWIDRFGSWLRELTAKADASQDVASELLEGAELLDSLVRLKADTTSDVVSGFSRTGDVVSGFSRTDDVVSGFSRTDADDDRILEIADLLRSGRPQAERVDAARDPHLRTLVAARPDRSESTTYDRVLRVTVDPVRARFGAWYEMFPRSCTSDSKRSGTFREAEARLPDIAAMGFDVVYLPPVHPIGRTHRKGRNNSLGSSAGDPGSPWAIGSDEGGHTAIEPGLGTLHDFERFVETASHLRLDVALDIAFQASPDHPWVHEHPEWFRHRPDGSIKYAENPPKKYQDIYPFDFGSSDRPGLWTALRDVFLFWIEHGVRIFRVDNPHTKPFGFWEWCIADIKRSHPDAVFLSEAFTRPKVMRYLAKAGFTQSYTYFTWRNSASELREYLTELTRTEVIEYLRPNFFANTPDILHEYLQRGGRPAFEVRFVLAATLAASYGIYSGFELCENTAIRHGSEEYLDSEKYQIKPRNWNQPGNLKELIARVNAIRRDHPALQQNATLRFHGSSADALLWFSKKSGSDLVFVAANTTPHDMQHGWVEVPIHELGIAPDAPYVVEDLLDEATYTWRGAWNYVRLEPAERMAHIFVIRHP